MSDDERLILHRMSDIKCGHEVDGRFCGETVYWYTILKAMSPYGSDQILYACDSHMEHAPEFEWFLLGPQERGALPA